MTRANIDDGGYIGSGHSVATLQWRGTVDDIGCHDDGHGVATPQ